MEGSATTTRQNKEKQTITVHKRGSAAFQCAVAETQGKRDSFEDAHAIHCGKRSADLWILDGHRGAAAARLGAPALVEEVGGAIKDGRLPKDDVIRKGFRAVDKRLRDMLGHKQKDRNAGTTVTGALLTVQRDGTYTAKLANCGDSRAVVVRGPEEKECLAGPVLLRRPSRVQDEIFKEESKEERKISKGERKDSKENDKLDRKEKKNYRKEKDERRPSKSERRPSKDLTWPGILETEDHKPDLPVERARIEAAGGHVCERSRVDGRLGVSRGLGDFQYKANPKKAAADQKVSCIPDIYEISPLLPGALLILGCDGLWDVISSEAAADFAYHCLGGNGPCQNVGEVAAALVRSALSKGSKDNVTVMVAQLANGEAWEDAPEEQAPADGVSA